MINTIAIIGAGTMGNGIAHTFALSGYKVHLIDKSSQAIEKAYSEIEQNLTRQAQKDIITSEEIPSILTRITSFTSIKDAVTNVDLVIEAATENEDIKKKIFMELDICTPKDCILSTNTSSISITKLANITARPNQVIGFHFMNPVPVMKLVEVINGHKTSMETTNTIIELTKSIKKTPVTANDYPGFIANRILMPMINEAIHTFEQRVGGIEEIDTIMTLGMAHPMGPLKLADFIGLDVCHSILMTLYNGFGSEKYYPCQLLTKMVNANDLGRKTKKGFYDWSDQKNPIPIDKL